MRVRRQASADSRQAGVVTFEERHLNLVRTLLRILAIGLLLVLVLIAAVDGVRALLQINSLLLMVLILAVLLALIRIKVGALSQAVWIILIGMFLLLGFETVDSGLTSSVPYLFGYSVPVVFAALMVGRRALIITVLASVTLVSVTYFGQVSGWEWVGTQMADENPTVVLAVFALITGLLALTLERFGVEVREAHLRAVEFSREQGRLVDELEREIEQRELAQAEREAVLELERSARLEAEALSEQNERLLAEIRALNEGLERRVAERTRELSFALGELETFTYSAAHDLRSPLRGIDGFCQALIEDYGDRLDADAINYLERIRAGAKRLGQLIDDLLLLSRLSRRELKVVPLDLSAIAAEVVADLRRRDPHRQVAVEVFPGMKAQGDAKLIDTALQNIIGNAWKFTRSVKDARLEIGQMVESGETVYFVRDNGIGFDMDYAEKLFVPFQKLHSPQEFEGSGIGLTMAERVINRHRGRIWARSEPGVGTVVYFTLGM